MKTPIEWKTIFEGMTFSEGDDTFERFIENVQKDARNSALEYAYECLMAGYNNGCGVGVVSGWNHAAAVIRAMKGDKK